MAGNVNPPPDLLEVEPVTCEGQLGMLTPALEPVQGLVRNDHPATSRAAAAAISGHIGRGHILVLRALAERGPLTDEQLTAATGLTPSTERPRRVELCRRELVVDSGLLGVTIADRPAIRWELTDAGRAALP
jgi:hypothetical protein